MEQQQHNTCDPKSSNALNHHTDSGPHHDEESMKEVALQSVDLAIATCSTAKPFTLTTPNQNAESSNPPLSQPCSTAKSLTLNTPNQNAESSSPTLSHPCSTAKPTLTTPNPNAQSSKLPRSQPSVLNCSEPSVPKTPETEPQNTPLVPIEQPQRISLFLKPLSSAQVLSNRTDQPKSLFLQALSRLSESSPSLAIVNQANSKLSNGQQSNVNQAGTGSLNSKSPDDLLKTPDSLTSAPPSYSYVLRQSAARQRPRLMGTFIPSPSFVNHVPPPNYAAAFDIYVDNTMPSTPIRVFEYGFTSIPALCQECGYTGMTVIVTRITLSTHFCAIFLCLFCCWLCVPLPYLMKSCKDVRHYCRNCGNFLGMYSPIRPEAPNH